VTIFRDARFALRTLARNPGFSAVAILTLGLGIGMSVAVWSVVDAVLIEPLPYPDADRLVEIGMTEPSRHAGGYPMSALDYREYSERNQSFEAMAATFRENLNLTGGTSPKRVSGAWVSAPFFTVMGVEPQLGRPFSTDEDVQGRDLVAVISHGLWQRNFGGEPEVLGKTVVVNGQSRVVVGVAPRDFAFPRDTELWLPIAIDWQEEDRGHGWVVPYGRIRHDLSFEEARTDLERIASQLRDEQPDTNADRSVTIVPVKETIVGEIRPAVSVLLAAVAGVLLIAAANVSILLLFRSILRQHEIAIRQSLGARRGQLIRQLMVESTLLALAGGIVGLAFAHWSTGLLRVRFAELIPRSEGVGVDLTVFGFALALSVAIGLRLVAGRFIQEADAADAPQVVVVNETFVRQLVPHGGPVGRRTTGYDPDDPEAEWQTIVGVVENVRHIDLADEAGPEMYIPVAQSGFEWATLVVRARSGNAEALAEPIRTTIQRLDPELPVFSVTTLEDVRTRWARPDS